MRLGTHALLGLTNIEMGQVLHAMYWFRKQLHGWAKDQFDIALNEVKENHEMAKLDGSQMQLIIDALKWKAARLFSQGHTYQSIICKYLASKVLAEKYKFQLQHNPLNGKSAS